MEGRSQAGFSSRFLWMKQEGSRKWNVGSTRVFSAALLLMALAGMGVVLAATRWGAGLSDDSYFYIKPARDILAGRAPFFSPHYPPLLPLIITLLGFLRIEPLLGIRLFNAACFGLNIFLGGWIVYRLTTSRGAGIVGALLCLVSHVMVEAHSWAMSEALFISLMFATIWAFDGYRATRKLGWIIAGAVLAGCAALTRYAGIAVIASGAILLFLFPGDAWKRRLRNAIGFSVLAGLLFALYPVGYAAATQKLASFGGINFVLIGLDEFREGFYNLLLWIMPGRYARGKEALLVALLLGLVILLAVVYALWRREAARSHWKAFREQTLFLLLVLLVGMNLFMLYQAHLSPVYHSPFDQRLLLPTHAILLLLVTGLLGLVWKENHWIMRFGLLVLLAWVVFLYLPRTIDLVTTMRAHGAGFAAPYWHDLDAGKFFASHRQDEIITTAPMGVYFSLGQDVKGISMNPEQLRDHLRQTGGYLVVFESMPLELYGYPAKEFLQGLLPVEKFSDCVVYQVQP
jgi:hypothetical protein